MNEIADDEFPALPENEPCSSESSASNASSDHGGAPLEEHALV